MIDRNLLGVSRKHARDFTDAVSSRNRSDGGNGNFRIGILGDKIVARCCNGNLRGMRDYNHLVRARKIGKNRRKGASGCTAHASIDFIKNHRRNTVGLAEDNAAGKHDTRKLASRSDATQRTRR